ncbi:uncharacterized protein LOC129595588 isoform X2 [Paramacrobiotus metropolitanus]|uniref:uncharacterized protein LOC129595588 isoform X2 n=1 Tax=Paramacrobiotus metropolitanus TaxID=2943436 RepID=UPI002445B1E1|nr:uncharacterized protein LOC129595588 isoform X2 [Paramacrobiotus metropolitanus]
MAFVSDAAGKLVCVAAMPGAANQAGASLRAIIFEFDQDADIPEAPGTEAFLTALHLTADMRNHFEGWRNVIGEGQARYVYLRPDHLIGNQAALLNSIRGVLAAGVTCAAAMERRH